MSEAGARDLAVPISTTPPTMSSRLPIIRHYRRVSRPRKRYRLALRRLPLPHPQDPLRLEITGGGSALQPGREVAEPARGLRGAAPQRLLVPQDRLAWARLAAEPDALEVLRIERPAHADRSLGAAALERHLVEGPRHVEVAGAKVFVAAREQRFVLMCPRRVGP